MSGFSLPQIRHAVEAAQAETAKFLCDLIRFPSLPGEEQGAVDYAAARFAEVAEVERVPLLRVGAGILPLLLQFFPTGRKL
jgi:acetylornithine deacetylase/succinyl-diaminopimelate desuccinylase-like protein